MAESWFSQALIGTVCRCAAGFFTWFIFIIMRQMFQTSSTNTLTFTFHTKAGFMEYSTALLSTKSRSYKGRIIQSIQKYRHLQCSPAEWWVYWASEWVSVWVCVYQLPALEHHTFRAVHLPSRWWRCTSVIKNPDRRGCFFLNVW